MMLVVAGVGFRVLCGGGGLVFVVVFVVVILLVLNCAQLQKRNKVRLHRFLVGLMVILDGFCNGFTQDLFMLLLVHLDFGFWR
ncbi:hypothetical protein MtrunA17_Chr7g0267271 [Medicago truncatula]|uniref:Transmembrane protein n=1 Tax=Medicago truncatula TaxID=3880 RepID=A0A396H667_MEDTR|nr:hypothetical protein MtrunA17_Chr7g0267271 [Medicago truncatula]